MIDDNTRLIIMGMMMLGFILLIAFGGDFYDDDE